ncbi:DNA cytosine methyltransferase [Enterococcus termitis]
MKDVLEKEVEEKFYISDEAAENLLKKSNNPEAVMQDKSMLGMDGYVRGYDVYSPTITAREYKEPRLVQVGQLFQTDSFGGNPQAGRVYDAEGVSPTLNTMQGGNRQPKVILPAIGASRGRPSESGKYEQHLEINRGEASNTLTGVLKDNYVINQNYRIRKLTPLECWRLMDFNDEDFYKAQKVCSNSQLYKQAGNSIVKAVLMAIFRQMFFEQRGNGKEEFQMIELTTAGAIRDQF